MVGKLAEGLLWHRAQLAKEDRDELLCELRGLKVGRFEIGDNSVKTVGRDNIRGQRSVANLILHRNRLLLFGKNLGVLRFNSTEAVTEDAAEDEAVARETLELDSNIVVELKSTNLEIDHGRAQAQFDLENGTVLVDGALFAFEELMNGQSNLIMKNIRIETSIFSKFIDKLIKILVLDLFSNVSSNEAGHLQSGGGERIFSHWEACRMGCEAWNIFKIWNFFYDSHWNFEHFTEKWKWKLNFDDENKNQKFENTMIQNVVENKNLKPKVNTNTKFETLIPI